MHAQSELEQFANSLDNAHLQESVLLVYFFASESDQPSNLLELFDAESRETVRDQINFLNIDISSALGFEIAEAFFDIGDLEPPHRTGPIIGVVNRDGRRGLSVLGSSIDLLDSVDWSLFMKNVSQN